MRSASSPPTVASITISNSVVITSMQASIARLAMPRSARGTMLPKLRLQPDSSAAGFAHHASATGNLTMPALVEAGIAQSEGGWLTPELLRLKGELLLAQRTSGAAETAGDLFRQALDGARRQETLSWELRAATSLARLL